MFIAGVSRKSKISEASSNTDSEKIASQVILKTKKPAEAGF
jgi:hypothetical protein